MSDSDYHNVAVVCTILSATSILGSCWIIYAAIKRKRLEMSIEEFRKDYIVTDYVLYMSMYDVCSHIMTLLYYSGLAAHSTWIQNVGENLFPLCWIFGFIIQFAVLSSATWSFSIALNIWWLMNGVEYEALIPESWNIGGGISVKKHKVIMTCFALFMSGLASSNYGLTPNADDTVVGEYECWIHQSLWQMVLYAPVTIYIMVTVTILCKIILIKCNCLQSSNPIQNKLAMYSLLFTFEWIWPCLNRYWGFSNVSSPPFGIVAMHHIMLSSIGLGNFFIWTWPYNCNSERGIGFLESNSELMPQGNVVNLDFPHN